MSAVQKMRLLTQDRYERLLKGAELRNQEEVKEQKQEQKQKQKQKQEQKQEQTQEKKELINFPPGLPEQHLKIIKKPKQTWSDLWNKRP